MDVWLWSVTLPNNTAATLSYRLKAWRRGVEAGRAWRAGGRGGGAFGGRCSLAAGRNIPPTRPKRKWRAGFISLYKGVHPDTFHFSTNNYLTNPLTYITITPCLHPPTTNLSNQGTVKYDPPYPNIPPN